MSLLQPLGTGQGYLKAGLLGFAKSGKTYTATELAIGTRRAMNAAGPIAFYDTEGGSSYVAKRVRSQTGRDLVGIRSRSFDDLLALARECEDAGVAVLIVDSVTHVWRELCDAYLFQLNERLQAANRKKKWNLEFQDWNPIKAKWAKWTDWYLNSRCHVIICGRAGFEYDQEKDEDGKKQLVKTGTKMKVENEFGFEPSLLIEMERVPFEKRGKNTMVNRATIIGDRFSVLTGKSCDNPTYEFFAPHVELLTPGAHAPIDTTIKSDLELDDQGSDPWAREKRLRQIFAEEIQGEMIRQWPGQTTAEKKAKADKLFELFGTTSWSKVESNIDSSILRDGLGKLRKHVETETRSEADAAFDAIGGAQ